MMTNSEIYDVLETAIKGLSRRDLLDLHNQYVEDNRYWNDWIRPWDELDEEFENCTPSQLFEIFRNCKETGDYFQRSIYGINIGDIYDLVRFDDLTDWVFRTMDGYGIEELEDIIDEYLEPEEDEEEEDDE